MINLGKDNDCVGCDYCINCGRGDYLYAEELVCDKCNEYVDELFYDESDGEQLCIDCATKKYFDKITFDNAMEYVDFGEPNEDY